jgi:hypothetical protein
MDEIKDSETAKGLKKGVYKHYKGKMCRVLGVAHHSETLEEMVVYQEEEGKLLWVRPLRMFLEEVEVDGKKVKRFARIE